MRFSILLQRILAEARWYEAEVTIEGLLSVMSRVCGIPDDVTPLGKRRKTRGVLTKAVCRQLECCTDSPVVDIDHVASAFREQRMQEETPIVKAACRDLVKEARAGKLDPVIGRDSELECLVRCLLRRKKKNAIITGTAGVGKTALVEKLAQAIASGDIPKALEQMPVYALDIMELTVIKPDVARALIKEFERADLILFIDEIHLLMDQRFHEVAEVLKPVLSRGRFRCIGATTREEYVRNFSQDAAFRRRFERIDIKELSEEETANVLRGIAPLYENSYGVLMGDDVLRAIISFSKRYLPGVMPDKCIDTLEQICARKALQSARPRATLKDNDFLSYYLKKKMHSIQTTRHITLADVRTAVETATGIESACDITHAELRRRLNENIVGMEKQKDIIVSHMVKAHNVHRAHGALGTMLFVGREGMGKEFMARSLCKAMFGSDAAFLCLNIAYYSDHYNVSKLVGSPPGYIGYESGGGILSKFVRDHPMGIIFLDNLSEDTTSVAMTIFKDAAESGKITDASGSEIDFRNHIFIGSYAGGPAVSGFQTCSSAQSPPVAAFLKPIIPFRKLTSKERMMVIKKTIAKIMIDLKQQGIELSVTNDVYEWLHSHSEDIAAAITNINTQILDRIEYRDKKPEFVLKKGRVEKQGA